MAMLLQAISRNASVNGRTALVNGGTLRLREGSTTICDIPLAATAFDAASAGAATARGGDGTNPIGAGNPLTAAATADATTGIDNYQVLTSGAALAWEGDVGAEMTLSATIVGTGVNINVTSWTHSQPAGS